MFNWQQGSRISFFIIDDKGNKIPTINWNSIRESYVSQLSIIDELVDNGVGEYTVNTCEVDIEDILELGEIDRQIINLPDYYPYEIYIKSEGILNESSFKFDLGFFDFTPNGNRFHTNRNGAIVELDGRRYLLSKTQFLLCVAIEEFNGLSESARTFQSNLISFAAIKSLSASAAGFLDSYLQSQHVHIADKIKIDVDFRDGVLEIKPSLNIKNGEGFIKTFDLHPRIKDVYAFSDGQGHTIRAVFDDNSKDQLQKSKAYRRVSDPKVIEGIAENPAQFLGEELDLSVFYSDRVIEIGLYKPKFYPFVCPYKSEWIPGISIKSKTQGEKRIYFKTEVLLKEFEVEYNTAVSENKPSVEWKGDDIPIVDAAFFINVAKQQFKEPQKAISLNIVKDEKEVLIIKENADFLDYETVNNHVAFSSQVLAEVDNLSRDISLKVHQKIGIAWLQSLFKNNYGGCLLADDMGLGKTLQLLYFIEWHSHNQDTKPYLIVAPISLLENWEKEYERFFNPKGLEIVTISSISKLTNEINKADIDFLQRKQIILTNYETLRSYQLLLGVIDFAVVVLDEAQKIKTPGTLITNASKALKADFKIAMTGTPVENTLVDLWCIMDFSSPGLLGHAKDFAKEYQRPLQGSDVDIVALGKQLHNRLGNSLMRRLKVDVLKDLPAKTLHFLPRVMPIVQLERYKDEITLAKAESIEGTDKRNQILKSLWAIRDISDHPFLVDKQTNRYSAKDLIATSAKLQVIVETLTKIQAAQEKVIIFADRKETQAMLRDVTLELFSINASIINGDTPATKQKEGKAQLSRQQTVDRYQSKDGFNVVIMSPLAAGVGLNVTGANHVIHYTRHWNPAKEMQATDRAYRIGQTKEVHVYYPMAVFSDDMINEDGSRFKSFDELLNALLERKQALANSTLFPTEQAEVRPDEIFEGVFNIDVTGQSLPLSFRDIEALTPRDFEAYVAVLYSKMGFDSRLTPYTKDMGADVVAMKEGLNYLIQVKQCKSLIGIDAIKEIVGAKAYYERLFNEEFETVVLSNSTYGPYAVELASAHKMHLFNRSKLEEMSSQHQISMQDVKLSELRRMVTL